MKIVKTVAEIQELLAPMKAAGKTIGFVPTMGALHNGHLSLTWQAVADNDLAVVSIFVNPTQFNNKMDLEKYPRNLDADQALLEQTGVDILFAPSVDEVYPEIDMPTFDFGQLDKVMEGKHRPGHFDGVAQVVSRLFDIVKPDRAYFGEKDFQQLAIVRAMVAQLNLTVEIVPMPIVREKSGLAMSSRNERLTVQQKLAAAHISKALLALRNTLMNSHSVQQAIGITVEQINMIEELDVEYLEIVDGSTLMPIANWNDSNYSVACAAVFCGEVRLIDAIRLK